ncbi:glycosyl transferase [Clostridium botulinum]|uniref:glycosyltransferase n=1 Tax=Clostridium botulinum TaxID=1491 RepID=UPI0013C97897|nr:glycosyl transferase [Clostridium botulinum]NFN18754.1 glycosyl transferase [Clostridium botulinum]NFN48703.1 glycosyl transferase [Clostridium botulinum]
MIPKKIHYCWFGKNKIPEFNKKCIESWKEYCPDYEIIEWNEDNFDISCNQYVKEAYEAKKYAFVTDYVRLYAIYHHGGVYMDTDVEVLKCLDKFLRHGAFTGCENNEFCVTGTMGAEKGNVWIKQLLNQYKEKKFILPNGKINIMPNTETITKLTSEQYSWVCENKYQILKDGVHIYPHDFFCAKDWRTGTITITENTYTVHNFSASWITEKERKTTKRKKFIKDIIIKFIGRNKFEKLKMIIMKEDK